MLDLRTKLHTLGQLSMENLLQAQDKQSRLYNRGARLRNFTPGDKVLVLLPTSSSKLLAKWQGLFEVTRRVGDLNYEVVRTNRSGAHQIYHLNLLKKWNEVEPHCRKSLRTCSRPGPGRTNLIQHHIETEPGMVVRSRPYRLPYTARYDTVTFMYP